MANQERLATAGGPNLFEKEDAAIAERRPTEERSFDNTRAFLSELSYPPDTIKEDEKGELKNYIPPVLPIRGAPRRYERNFHIVSMYTSSYSKNTQEIADKFSLSRGEVGRIIRNTIKTLWENTPNELQEKYPLETLSTDKRETIRFGLRGKVVKLIEEGEDPKTISEHVGLNNMTKVRRTLSSRFGFETPPVRGFVVRKFTELGETTSTGEEIQKLLDQVTRSQYQTLIKSGLIVNLTRVARNAELHPDTSDILPILNELREHNIPTRRLPYHLEVDGKKVVVHNNFIAARDLSRATEILENSAKFSLLKDYPVSQVAGPESPLPNTNDLKNKDRQQLRTKKL